MANGIRGERLQIMLAGEELTVLDDFRFRKRMPSRAAAIRELLKRGLAAEGFETAAFGAKSEEYGVIGSDPLGRKK
ncbi:MAG TPA: hypothetical protein VIY07_00215 [Pseudolabrys sp.]